MGSFKEVGDLEKIAKVGFWFGLTGSILFLILVSISHYFAIIGGYDWRIWELSELVLYGTNGKIFFMAAAIIYGLCLFGILIPMGSYFEKKQFRTAYYIIAVLVAFMLILVGAVDEDRFMIAHYVIGVLFFLTDGIVVLMTAIYIYRVMKHIPKFYSIFGFITFGVLIFHVATREFFGMAYTQRITVLMSMIYLLLVSGRLIFGSSEKIAQKMKDSSIN